MKGTNKRMMDGGRRTAVDGGRVGRAFEPVSMDVGDWFVLRRKKVTIRLCHCEPFFGEAISHLSGQLDRLGIASSQRTLLAMTNTTGLMQG
jgi:hypothetical protein